MNRVLLGLLLAASSASLAGAANLLVNPGFETPVTSDGPPFVGSWESFNSTGSTAVNTPTLPRTGAQALTLTITGTPNTFAGAFQDVGVVIGTEYTFSGFHATTTALLQVGVEARIEWRNSGTNSEVSRTPNLTPVPILNTYTPFSFNAVAPAGADTARIVYAIQSFSTAPNGNGAVHLDDVAFEPVPEPSSLGLLALGTLAWMRRHRRQN
jgi:hypothetical protein